VPGPGAAFETALLIGVTGHRDIDPADRALGDVVVSGMRAVCARRREAPVVVVSSLAEGADRLIAQAAMTGLGAALVAPLPLPPDEYEKDFPSPESRRELRRLLAAAATWFVLPGGEGSPAGEARSCCYARAGAYVARHSNVLVALWDGKPSRGTGGTADVVAWRRDGRVPDSFVAAPDPDPLPVHRPDGQIIHVMPEGGNVVYIPPDLEAWNLEP
jgi:hypothetical protein